MVRILVRQALVPPTFVFVGLIIVMTVPVIAALLVVLGVFSAADEGLLRPDARFWPCVITAWFAA